jgi:hypothetical protein
VVPGGAHGLDIEGEPHRIRGVLGAPHVRGGILGAREIVDLQLDEVAVGIAVVQRRGDAVLYRNGGRDAFGGELAVPVEQVVEAGEREGRMVQAGGRRALNLIDQSW